MLQSRATTTGQTDRDPNNTDEVSLYPRKCPKRPPHPHQHLRSQTPAAHLRHPPNHHTPATAKGKQKHLQHPETQKPLRTPLLQPQLRNSQRKQRLTLPSSWTPMGSSYKKKNCFQAVKQQNSGAQKQVMPSEYFLTPALAHPHISSYTQAPTT